VGDESSKRYAGVRRESGAIEKSDVYGSPCSGGSGEVFHSASFGVCLTLLGRVDDAVQFQVFLLLYHIVPHKSSELVMGATEGREGNVGKKQGIKKVNNGANI
jgi:hypothetical protein